MSPDHSNAHDSPGSASPNEAPIAADRLRKIEENAAQTEYAVEQVNAEMVALWQRVRTLADRLQRLEQRLEGLAAAPENSGVDAEPAADLDAPLADADDPTR